ncbi:MAG: hypothetical protein F6K41_08205 [Symploca sp. SIO3E6]|nr:hypothetical protein [Caldora sp. SIO3E6]
MGSGGAEERRSGGARELESWRAGELGKGERKNGWGNKKIDAETRGRGDAENGNANQNFVHPLGKKRELIIFGYNAQEIPPKISFTLWEVWGEESPITLGRASLLGKFRYLIKLELGYCGDYNSVQAQIIASRLNFC